VDATGLLQGRHRNDRVVVAATELPGAVRRAEFWGRSLCAATHAACARLAPMASHLFAVGALFSACFDPHYDLSPSGAFQPFSLHIAPPIGHGDIVAGV
jgi:hypothetical protein